MRLERQTGAARGPPFPVYQDLAASLLAAHGPEEEGRNATVAHVLGTCAGYAYADIETVATMMARLGLEGNACVRITQTVDAMFIFSTAYLVQTRCGRVVILCYRGTEPANLANWLGDADVGSTSITLGAEVLGVHSGFYRNVCATRWAVINELNLALQGRSLRDPEAGVENPLQALYVTGHSLGGAMALLFSLSLAGTAEHRAIGDRVRAVYTFGQPMAAGEPLPGVAREVGRKLFRHVASRDLVPALPPAPWGRFAHFGWEYRYVHGEWQRSETPVAQLANAREVPRALLAFFGTAKRRDSSRYTLADHGPHHYISALRPKGLLTEFGDRG
jgi:hypothetical protein